MAEPYGPEGSMYQPRPLTLIICLMSNLKVNVAHRGSQGPRNSRERNPRLNCAKGNGFWHSIWIYHQSHTWQCQQNQRTFAKHSQWLIRNQCIRAQQAHRFFGKQWIGTLGTSIFGSQQIGVNKAHRLFKISKSKLKHIKYIEVKGHFRPRCDMPPKSTHPWWRDKLISLFVSKGNRPHTATR